MTPADASPSVHGQDAKRYTDHGLVAHGGMGVIRRVRDNTLLRTVAMKVLSPKLAYQQGAVAQFVTEAQVTGQLDHPNIVPVHELAIDAAGTAYFTMKLVQGETFAAELRSVGGPPGVSSRLDEFLGVFLKVCDAVAFAHSRGVIHRDLKPANIMVGSFGQVYVMDWGLARILPRGEPRDAEGTATRVQVTNEGAARVRSADPVGTLLYMSPEQARGKGELTDERTDVFLLGGMIYEILTGLTPYEGANPMEVLYNAGLCTVVAPQERLPGAALPRELCRIAMKALSAEPADRYASVLELKRDVERFLRGDGRFPSKTFAAGARVVTEGEEGDAAYVILSGQCQAFKTAGGEKVVLRKMGAGDVFGETAIFSSKPRTASVEALEELTVLVVTRDSIAEGLAQQPWLLAFVRTLADRFRELDERMSELSRTR